MAPDGKAKVAVIGLDAIIPAFAEKMIEAGKLPNLKKLRDSGYWSELIPTAPAWTPTGWATVATGANGSTHGIEGFFIHDSGEDFAVEHPGFDSNRCKVEFVWEAAVRNGKKPILLKYPGSWPPRSQDILQVGGGGGYGGLLNPVDISHAVCYASDTTAQHAWPVEMAEPVGWTGLPEGASRVAEVELPVVYNRPARPTSYWLLAYTDENGVDTALLTKSKDASKPLAVLRAGQWSDFIFDTFPLDEDETEGAFRLKLIDLDVSVGVVSLFMSQNLSRDGYCVPPELDAALWDAVGPPTEYTAYKHLFWNWFDLPTQMEIYDDHVVWMENATRYLLTDREWDLFYTQIHIIDYAQHILWGGFDPLHPDYKEEEAQDYWGLLEETYALTDRYVGTVMDLVDEDTVVMVVGDHGHQPYRWSFYVNNLLRQQGLLDVLWNESLGRLAVDWQKTKAYCYGPIHIAINLRGRDPDGIVEPEDYEALQEELVDMLYDVKHEVTGKRPVKLVMTRQEADYFGLYGDGIGDVVFFTRNGYDSANAERMGQGPGYGYDAGHSEGISNNPLSAGVTESGELFRATGLMNDMTSEHPSQMPSEKLTRSLLCMSGPGVKKDVRRKVPTSIVNVTATVCDLLGMPYPSGNEGNPIVDAFG